MATRRPLVIVSGQVKELPSGDGLPASASGLTLLASLTPTASANIDFLTLFSSSYDNYVIIGNGIKFAADDGVAIRLAVAGSVVTSSDYIQSSYSGGEFSITSGNATVTGGDVRATGIGANFKIEILNVNSTVKHKLISSNSIWGSTSGSNNNKGQNFPFVFLAAGVVTGFRIYSLFGANFSTVGSIRVYGYQNT